MLWVIFERCLLCLATGRWRIDDFTRNQTDVSLSWRGWRSALQEAVVELLVVGPGHTTGRLTTKSAASTWVINVSLSAQIITLVLVKVKGISIRLVLVKGF